MKIYHGDVYAHVDPHQTFAYMIEEADWLTSRTIAVYEKDLHHNFPCRLRDDIYYHDGQHRYGHKLWPRAHARAREYVLVFFCRRIQR